MTGKALPREHGTERGYQQHRARGDMPACQPCRTAHAAHVALATTGARPRQCLDCLQPVTRRARRCVGCARLQRRRAHGRRVALHGSPAGYRRHLRDGTLPCPGCLRAHAADVAAHGPVKPARKRVQQRRWCACGAAIGRNSLRCRRCAAKRAAARARQRDLRADVGWVLRHGIWVPVPTRQQRVAVGCP